MGACCATCFGSAKTGVEQPLVEKKRKQKRYSNGANKKKASLPAGIQVTLPILSPNSTGDIYNALKDRAAQISPDQHEHPRPAAKVLDFSTSGQHTLSDSPLPPFSDAPVLPPLAPLSVAGGEKPERKHSATNAFGDMVTFDFQTAQIAHEKRQDSDTDSSSDNDVMELHHGGGRLFASVFSYNGDQLASGGEDGKIRIWDVESGSEEVCFDHGEDWVWSVDISIDGTLVASGGEDGSVVVWDTRVAEKLFQLSHSSSESAYCAVKSVRFSGPTSNPKPFSIEGDAGMGDDANDANVGNGDGDVDDDGGSMLMLATSGEDGMIRVWDALSGKLRLTMEHGNGEASCVDFSSDSRRLVSGGEDGNVKVWDAIVGRELLCLEHGGGWVFSVAFSDDGAKVVSGGSDGNIVVWDAVSCELVLCMEHGADTSEVRSVCFSADDRYVVSGGSDSNVKLWDTETGNILNTFVHGGGCIFGCTISTDRTRVASAGKDGNVKVWHLEN